jgi:transposase InsO family protein
VAKYMVRRSKPPSQHWRTFLDNHLTQLASVDFFTVPTVTFRLLYVFIVLRHDRRRIVHFNVTDRPTAAWTGQQIVEAFPFDSGLKYLLRDRDKIFGLECQTQIEALTIQEVLTAPRSPWQNPYAERVIGSIRRECLDHFIVLNEESLRRILREYFAYYHRSRLHLSLDKDSPDPRAVFTEGDVVAISEVGGLHHLTNVAPRNSNL